jgi:flagellar M-ring protein FliF
MDENLPLAFLYRVPGLRQLVLLAGLALAISAGVTAAFWMREPSYTMLFSNISSDEATEIVGVLTGSDIRHRVDPKSGAILVPADQVHDARLRLAAQGLPRGAGFGLEIMQEDAGFATSQFMENARYHHALETELARTIGKLRPVQSARVHLAVPDATVFLRKSRQPSASVLVNLYPGRELEKSQIAAVVHLVASSIPGLESERVTVVDQQGRLLNAPGSDNELGLSAQQFAQLQRIETTYAERIVSLLTPILGPDRVRATVTAELDFTVREETREDYDPDNTAVRSEQVAEDRQSNTAASGSLSGANGGVPGALSNTPPPPVVASNAANPAPASATAATSSTTASTGALTESTRRTRNYEVDRVLSHTRNPAGRIERLSVAVLVDHKRITGDDGEVTTQPLSQQELDDVTRLVKDAVGFSQARGDSVSVSNVSFYENPVEEEIEEPGILESAAVFETGRTVLAGLVGLAIAFVVIRPIMRGLGLGATGPGAMAPGMPMPAGFSGPAAVAGGATAMPARMALSFDDKVSVARQLADKNPERVAQIVKSWMQSDA